MNFPSESPEKHTKVERKWESIAEEVSRETDPKKVFELVEELNRALDEQRRGGIYLGQGPDKQLQ